MITHFIVIDKSSLPTIKTFTSNENLYKACNFRKSDDFECKIKFDNVKLNCNNFVVEIWGKTKGLRKNLNLFSAVCSSNSEINFYGNIAIVFKCDKYDINVDINLLNLFINFLKKLQNPNSDIESDADDEASYCISEVDINSDDSKSVSSCLSIDNSYNVFNEPLKELTYEPYYISD